MSQLFLTEFRASIAFAPPTNTLANVEQRDNETLTEYFKRFNAEVPKIRKTTNGTYKNFLIAGVRPWTDFWKELQGAEPKTLADFYARAETQKLVEESMAKLKMDHVVDGARIKGIGPTTLKIGVTISEPPIVEAPMQRQLIVMRKRP